MTVRRARLLRDLPDDVAVELVEQMFLSRMNVRWLSVIMLLPTIYGALHSDGAWTLPAAIAVWIVSAFRVAIAETYVRWGARDRSRRSQNRWRLIYLAGGTALALAFSSFVADTILRGDAWLAVCAASVAIGGAYGATPYVGLSPGSGLLQTLPYVLTPAVTLTSANVDVPIWVSAVFLGAALSIKGQSDRTYEQAVGAIVGRREVERLASTDALTGLWNRRQLESVVRQALLEGLPDLQWLGVDLDRFKAVNDRLGHEAGDLVLQATAARIQSVTGPDAFVARVGGDEFVVLLAGDRDRARRIADQIADVLANPIVIPQGTARFGASVGTTAICVTDTIDEIARRADERMYARKAATRLAA